MSRDPLRILITDDSAVYRSIVARCLEEIEGTEVVGKVGNGLEALKAIESVHPDLVLLDVEMPEMDGIQTLQTLSALHPDIGVVMVSSVDPRVATTTMKALELGAFDFVAKPTVKRGLSGAELLRPPLERVIQAFARSRAGAMPAMGTETPGATRSGAKGAAGGAGAAGREPTVPAVIGIGVSTGGPKTLKELLPTLPRNHTAPILVVQHLPEGFSSSLVETLSRDSPIPVHEAADGQVPRGGHVYIAPGGQHLVVGGTRFQPVLHLTQEEPVRFCRPSVDVLFRSLSEVYGPSVLSIVLTGMGSDGLEGVRAVRAAGGYSLCQDRESCIVYGMPKAVVEAGEADEVLPLDRIGSRVASIAARGAA